MTAVSLPALLAAGRAEHPDRRFADDVDGRSVSYAEALDEGGRWAGALATLGVGVGDRVATLVPNSVEATLLWLGISSLRAIEVPIHPAFIGHMLEHTLNTVGADVVVTEPDRLPALLASAPRLDAVKRVVVVADGATLSEASAPFEVVRSVDLLSGATAPALAGPPDEWDTAAIFFTSGTTGPSKGVVVPWGAVRATAERTFPFADLCADDVFYVFTPSSHIGAKALPYLAALVGGRCVLRPDFKIGEFLSDIRTHGITTAPVVGAIPHFLNQLPPEPDDADIPLRNVVMAPLVPDLDGFSRRFGVRICTAYNMTELSIPFVSEGWDVSNHRSVGKLLGGWPGAEVRLVDEHDMEVEVGEVGELTVRNDAPWAMNGGYFAMPEATADAWRNGWFHTGDAFTRDADGFYYFVDRIKDAIRRRGENVSSFEVETIVNTHPAVAESAAVAMPAETSEDEIKVFVVVKPETAFDPAELVEFLTTRMPRFMIPRFIEPIDTLPKTAGTLRVKKHELRQLGNGALTWDRQPPP